MITKVVLQNIKSHLDTTIEFGPHLNVIAGETDEGKSNVFRAIIWCLQNQPAGWNPKPWPKLKPGRKDSRVEVHFSDGNVVARVRTASKNYYELNGYKLEGMRGGVPEQVQEIVNMNDTNVQKQKDTFFLLNDTAGNVAKKINEVADLGKMAVAMKEADSRIKATNKIKTQAEAEVKNTKEQISAMSWLFLAQKELSSLITRQANINIKHREIFDTNEVTRKAQDAQTVMSTTPHDLFFEEHQEMVQTVAVVSHQEQELNHIVRSVDAVSGGQELLSKVGDISDAPILIMQGFLQRKIDLGIRQDKLSAINKSFEDTFSTKVQINRLTNDDCDMDIADLSERWGVCNELEGKLRRAGIMLMNTNNDQQKLDETETRLQLLIDTKAELMAELEVCPTCERPMNMQ